MALFINAFSQQFTIEVLENMGEGKALAREFFGF